MSDDPPVRRPRIARPASRTAALPLALGLLFVGTAVFAKMTGARGDQADSILGLPALKMRTIAAAQPMVQPKPATAAAFVPHGTPVVLQASSPAQPASTYTPRLAPLSNLQTPSPKAGSDRFSGSALILDLYQGRASRGDNAAMGQDQAGPAPESVGPRPDPPGSRSDPTGDAIAAANAMSPQTNAGTGNERFAQRVGSKQADASQAQQLQNLDRLIPQGSIVSAVMETALNSDLPGYARALVTKDVLSFDGSAVLIPAGSRIIGEYNSGVAQGASRIFIVWIRLIRPDGVSIALGSPAVDELGRGGC